MNLALHSEVHRKSGFDVKHDWLSRPAPEVGEINRPRDKEREVVAGETDRASRDSGRVFH
jgi:hypothetical protein